MTTKNTTTTLTSELELPCGAVLPNRIAKAAMSEQMAARDGSPTDALERLYRTWGEGGAGLLITGNVMIDRRAFVEPRNAVLEDIRHIGAFGRWAQAAHDGGAQIWMQINHPGRLAVAPLTVNPVGPSPVRVHVPGYNLRRPRALTIAEIQELVQRFARTAQLAVETGFDGVQIHAAHGYLLSQFLSPAANRREDEYGGDAEGRRRMLLEIVAATRDAVGPGIPVSVKLNCRDFERDGLSEDESLAVALELERAGVDLLEVSGGTYEQPAMQGFGEGTDGEGYFAGYVRRLREQSQIPVMLTGGLRTREFVAGALAAGEFDVAGIARPLAVDPAFPEALIDGSDLKLPRAPGRIGYKPIDAYAMLAWHGAQLRRIAAGQPAAEQRTLETVLKALTRQTVLAVSQG